MLGEMRRKRPQPRWSGHDVAARRSLKGYARWLVRSPGFGLRAASLATLVLAGASTGEAGERLMVAGITLAVMTPVTYVVWRYRWWRTRWWPEDR